MQHGRFGKDSTVVLWKMNLFMCQSTKDNNGWIPYGKGNPGHSGDIITSYHIAIYTGTFNHNTYNFWDLQ